MTLDEIKSKTPEELLAAIEEAKKDADRRATEAAKTRDKYWEEKNAKDKMTEEQKRQSEADEIKKELEALRLEKSTNEVTNKFRATMKESGLPDDLLELVDVTKFLGIENVDEAIKTKVGTLGKAFEKATGKTLEDYKKEALKGQTPMGEQTKNKQTVTEFDTAFKNGDALSMILSKIK